MIVRELKNCNAIVAGDGAVLRELFNPNKDDIDIGYSLAEAVIKVGTASKPHIMKTSEVYYIMEGNGEMHVNEEVENVSAGQAVYIPPNSKQYIKNTGNVDLKFMCIVDPAWKQEDEELV
ncbi:MAG: cupin domain-containing protein [Patescibacteria group bacterium]|jgi:mannose-6-phosphate isomerase-like protein (cupin superfamily)